MRKKQTLFPLKQSQEDYNDSIYVFYVDCEGSVCGFEIIGILHLMGSQSFDHFISI